MRDPRPPTGSTRCVILSGDFEHWSGGQCAPHLMTGFEAAFDVVASQTTLAVVESLTGLDFGALKASDHLAAGGVAGTLESAEFGGAARPLSDLEDIDF